jgi:hypothetical protein
MTLKQQVLLPATLMLLACSIPPAAIAEAVSADRIFINQSTIADTGFAVKIDGSISDVDLFYSVTAPGEFEGRKFKSFLVEVQFADEVVTTEAESGEVDGCHRISLSLTNAEERSQRVSLQVIYQALGLKVLVVYIDLESFLVNGSHTNARQSKVEIE